MIPSSKSKSSSAGRLTPPLAGARTAGQGVSSPEKRVSAQKFRVWPEDPRERIVVKAYELWEQRGCRHGHDLEDWLDAEAIVMQTLPVAHKSTDAGTRT